MVAEALHEALRVAAVDPMPGAGLFVTVVLVLLVLLGSPLFVVIGGFAVACFLAWPEFVGAFDSLDGFSRNFNLIERMIELAEQPTLVAIPFFMIAGAIMSQGAIARRLVDFANALFGWLPGGLALSTIAACMFFAAISGSSPVTVITIGAIMLPALAAAGYPDRLSLGLVTSAGGLGIIIPPSIPMIVYAIFASGAGEPVSIEDLFIAGIGPGLLIGLLLAGFSIVNARGVAREPFSARRVLETFLDGVWALSLPLVILGGIYLGLFNATEASAISVVLALGIELGIHRSITLDQVPGILGETAVLMGSILVIICVAFGFSEFMTIKQVPDAIVHWLAGFELTPLTFVLLLNGLLLVVGCLMDIMSAIILFVPLIAPIAAKLGLDPVHLGLIFIVNLEIGYLTPPLGLNLFVATTYFKRPFGEVIRSVLPFLVLLLGGLAIVTYVPTVSLGFLNARDDKPIWTPFPSGIVLAPEPDDEVGDDALLDDLPPPGPDDGAEAPESVQDLMNDPEYRRLMEEMGAPGPGAADEDDDEPLPADEDAPFPDEEPEPEPEPEEPTTIQDLMRDPAYHELMREMREEAAPAPP